MNQTWSPSQVGSNQHHIDDRKRGVENHKPHERADDGAARDRGDAEKVRQYPLDHPRLTTVFRDDPTELGGEPRQGQAPQRDMKEPALLELARRSEPKRYGEQCDEVKAEARHQ
jgi:hypothetical protein